MSTPQASTAESAGSVQARESPPVVVVGAGMAGLTCAAALHAAGRSGRGPGSVGWGRRPGAHRSSPGWLPARSRLPGDPGRLSRPAPVGLLADGAAPGVRRRRPGLDRQAAGASGRPAPSPGIDPAQPDQHGHHPGRQDPAGRLRGQGADGPWESARDAAEAVGAEFQPRRAPRSRILREADRPVRPAVLGRDHARSRPARQRGAAPVHAQDVLAGIGGPARGGRWPGADPPLPEAPSRRGSPANSGRRDRAGGRAGDRCPGWR